MPPSFESLRGARIVATVPSIEENGGWFHQAAQQLIEGMRRHGAEIFPFDVSYVHTGNITAMFNQLAALGEFKPELVISTPCAVHAWYCKIGSIIMGDGRYVPNNLFVDNLKLPTIMVWDTMADFFAQLGVLTLDPTPSRPAVLAALRDQINNPLYFHCAFDQQHVDTLRALGVLTTPNVKVRLAPAYPHHVEYGVEPTDGGYDEDVAFTGNLFSRRPPRGEGAVRATIERFHDLVLAEFDRDIGTSYWHAVEMALSELDARDREAARLVYDQSFFWEYLTVDLMSAAVTRSRMNGLRAAHHPVSVYGLMFDPQSAHLLADHPHLALKGKADYLTELPRLNRRTKVTLDVVTAHFPTSTTAKIANCFASGGVCLFNAKSAFHDAFGSAADAVMYRDQDDMNAKLDRLLSRDRERAELADHFKTEIQQKHTFTGLLAELVAWVKETSPQPEA